MNIYKCHPSHIIFCGKERIKLYNFSQATSSVFKANYFNQENLKNVPQMKNKKYNSEKAHPKKKLVKSILFLKLSLKVPIFRFEENQASYNFIM